MISCEHAQNLFDAYLNDEVPASLVAELDAHCLNCSNCRQQLSLLEACGHVVRLDTSEPVVSGDFTDRLVRILEEDHSRQRTMQLSRKVKVAGGLLGVAAVLALVVMLPTNDDKGGRAVLGTHTPDATDALPVPVTVPGRLLSDFLGVPLPLQRMAEGVSAVVELGEMTVDNMSDAAAAEKVPIEHLPIVPQPAHDGPDVLETLPSFEDDDGELM